MTRRFQFSFRALLLLMTGIGILLEAELVAIPESAAPSRIGSWILTTTATYVAMVFAGWAIIGSAVGATGGRGLRYAAYGAYVAALFVVCRFVWFLSDPLNFFPAQGLIDNPPMR